MSVRSSIAIVLLATYTIILSFSQTIYIAMLIPLCIELFRNKNELKTIFFQLLILNIFLIMLFITLWLSNDKNLALFIYLRSNMMVLFALLLFSKKDAFDIAFGLQELKVAPKITTLLFFVAKFIYIIKDNLKQFHKTLKLRGFESKTSLFTYQTYANFIGLLFINAIKKAKNLQNLMVLRGFSGKLYTLQETRKINPYEITLCILVTFSVLTKGKTFELLTYT